MNEQQLRLYDSTENVILHYSDMVYRLAYARMGSKQDADEIYQEVFLRYMKKQPVFQTEEHRKAWFLKVTVNCSNSLWNSLWRKRTEPLKDDLLWEDQGEIDLSHALKTLPAKYREVIHLYYYEDMSTDEISRLLGRKSSTVRTQLTRARVMLKKILKEDDYEF